MPKDPYAPSKSPPAATSPTPFKSYADVPVYRRQWFFWIFWLLCSPVSVLLLLSGEVYYVRGGEVRAFGIANRIVAGIIALIWIWLIVVAFSATPPT